jgi:hypothetical protein
LEAPVIDLSKNLFEALHKDEEFILSRGRGESDGSAAKIFLLGNPAPDSNCYALA